MLPIRNDATAIRLPEEGERRAFLVACHAWYGDVIGGSFRLASEFAEDLAARGHRVHYVCCARADASTPEPPAAETVRGVVVHRYAPPPPRTSRLGRFRWHVRESTRLTRVITTEAPVDAVSGHSPLQFLGVARAVGDTAAFKSYVVHSPFDDELTSNAVGRLARWKVLPAAWLAKRADRACLRIADRVQTMSRYTLETLVRKHGDFVRRKGIVAPGWVDAERFQPVEDRRKLRQQLGGDWDTDVQVFFTLRRLEARMGLDTLIEAAAQLVREGRKFRVLIGGSGALRSALEQKVSALQLQSTVRFLGRLPEEDLPHCYAAADCFVLPTRALECFGLIVLEAFAAGTPVIASKVAAIPELAGLQGEEWLFTPGNGASLSEIMRRVLTGTLVPAGNLCLTADQFGKDRILSRWVELLSANVTSSHICYR